jgi:hypothetical protein
MKELSVQVKEQVQVKEDKWIFWQGVLPVLSYKLLRAFSTCFIPLSISS